jgi:hypothetical protein
MSVTPAVHEWTPQIVSPGTMTQVRRGQMLTDEQVLNDVKMGLQGER